ncbi:MAG: transcriptional regulator, MerR family [Phenylobacterium sp.]|nr:transcriptional regulator, MerR family [Phenylobacterium sp.]
MCGIATICDQFGLTPRAVRFYEDRGLVQSGRDRLNCRRYDAQARLRLGQIAGYRQAGLSIEDIQEIFALEPEGPAAQRDCATQKLRARLLELETARQRAEQLLKRFAAERMAPVNGDAAHIRVAVSA